MHTPSIEYRLFTPEMYQYSTQYRKLLFAYRPGVVFIFSLNAHPLCAKQDVYQPIPIIDASSIILYPHAHHTWRPQYVIAFLYAVSSASLLFSSNFATTGFHGA
jgi:hypothetical protein